MMSGQSVPSYVSGRVGSAGTLSLLRGFRSQVERSRRPRASPGSPGPRTSPAGRRPVGSCGFSAAQVLWELRAPGADGDSLEATTAAGASEPRFYGRVSYLHADGINRPLSIWKEGVGSVRPHQNWRGQFARGAWGMGPLQGRSSDCAYGGAPDCIPLHWPGYRTNAWHQQSRAGNPEYWMGSLVDGMRDVTGQIYMRNRYYDPATGQFTQPDPIGIAGGLNSYGFATGDPVSYADPYGLCPANLVQPDGYCPDGMTHAEYDRMEELIVNGISGGAQTGLRAMLQTGRIIANEPMRGNERRVQAHHYPDARPSYLRIGPDFWSQGTADTAYTLAHDYAHVLQKQILGLIFPTGWALIDGPMDLARWNYVTAFPDDGGIGLAFYIASQWDADRYACSVTVAQSSYHATYC
jgi:RHS repeat-associated protein